MNTAKIEIVRPVADVVLIRQAQAFSILAGRTRLLVALEKYSEVTVSVAGSRPVHFLRLADGEVRTTCEGRTVQVFGL